MEKSPEAVNVADGNLVANAEEVINWEHALTPKRALRLYSKAVWIAGFVSLALVMEGFDTKVLGSLYAVPQFQEAYGTLQADGSRQIPASWQSGLGSGGGAASIVGMFIGGYTTERFGFRTTFMASLIAMVPIIFIFFFAPSLEVLAAAHFLFSEKPHVIPYCSG